MAKALLLQAACTVAMLAAAPAFAQTNKPTGGTGAAGAPSAQTTPGTAASAGTRGTMRHHRSAMHRSGGMHSAKGADAQDAAVDRLNEQSYQAAHQGQTLTAPAAGGGGTAAPSGSDSPGAPGGKL